MGFFRCCHDEDNMETCVTSLPPMRNFLLYMLGEKIYQSNKKKSKIGTFVNKAQILVIEKSIIMCWLNYLL